MSVETVTVVCTDREQHPSRKLRKLYDHRQTPHFVDDAGREWRGFFSSIRLDRPRPKSPGGAWNASYDIGGPPGPAPSTHYFRCPTCNREVRLSTENLGRIVDALQEHNRRVALDISRLPS